MRIKLLVLRALLSACSGPPAPQSRDAAVDVAMNRLDLCSLVDLSLAANIGVALGPTLDSGRARCRLSVGGITVLSIEDNENITRVTRIESARDNLAGIKVYRLERWDEGWRHRCQFSLLVSPARSIDVTAYGGASPCPYARSFAFRRDLRPGVLPVVTDGACLFVRPDLGLQIEAAATELGRPPADFGRQDLVDVGRAEIRLGGRAAVRYGSRDLSELRWRAAA